MHKVIEKLVEMTKNGDLFWYDVDEGDSANYADIVINVDHYGLTRWYF